MISILCYIVFYYNIDKVFQYIYLPSISENFYINTLSNNVELYFLLRITSYFMLILYSYKLLYRLLYLQLYDKFCTCLIFVYTKHIIDIILNRNMSIIEYELSRNIMWVFTTPIMLKMLCNTNDLSLQNINIHYHLLAIVPHTFMVPFKGKPIYIASTVIFSIPEIFFLISLYKYKHLPFINLFILIWVIFMLINILDIFQLFDPNIIHAFYNLADTLCKFICNVVISNYNEQEAIIRNNMDLQSIQFCSYMIKNIKMFEKENSKITPFCDDLIKCCKKNFINKIPKINVNLKLELLKKLLPFDLDKEYIMRGNKESSGTNKEFQFICVMFMDIVNYTELAKKYNGDTIFKLLNNIYSHFDNIIKKYEHLQKIETIGDAYMVVGDIYKNKNELNHKVVVKEMILLAYEFIKEIKTIKTPDDIPLNIRIGMSMGNVNIGILGNEIPRLCVVGNTVNVAARLQSTADVNTIQLSRHIYEQANEVDFGMNIEYKVNENVFLKNIGSVTTYTVVFL